LRQTPAVRGFVVFWVRVGDAGGGGRCGSIGAGECFEPSEEVFGRALASEGGDGFAVADGVGHGDGAGAQVGLGELGLAVDFDVDGEEGWVCEAFDDSGVVEGVFFVLLAGCAAVCGGEGDDGAGAGFGDGAVERRGLGEQRGESDGFAGDDEAGFGVIGVIDGEAVHPCADGWGRLGGGGPGLGLGLGLVVGCHGGLIGLGLGFGLVLALGLALGWGERCGFWCAGGEQGGREQGEGGVFAAGAGGCHG